MNTKHDIKSLLLGAALGTILVLAIGAATTQSFSSGRFQLVVSDSYIFKLDTTTGQVWRSNTPNPSAAFLKANIGE